VRPLDNVLVLAEAKLSPAQGKYKGSAGVVERIEATGVVVDMDVDHKRVSFPPAALRILKA
jgi:hypothetical protein